MTWGGGFPNKGSTFGHSTAGYDPSRKTWAGAGRPSIIQTVGAATPQSPPTVISLNIATGSTAGGTAIIITGTNFFNVTSVTIGGNPAAAVVVNNTTTIHCTTPAGTAGTADVDVATPAGTGIGAGLFTYMLDNGMSGAPVGGSFQKTASTWWTSYAPQSGQSYAGRRPPYYMAGIDYAIGIPAASFPLKTPSSGNMPSGASFAGGTVTIDSASTFDGFDFTGIPFDINSGATGEVVFMNSKFINTSAIDPSWWMTSFATANFSWINCEIDLKASSGVTAAGNGIIAIFNTVAGGGHVTFRYTSFLNTVGHAITHQNLVIEYCYFEGLNFNSGAHGEWTIIANADAFPTIPLIKITGTTWLQPANFTGGATGGIYLDSGVGTNTWVVTNIQIDHSQFINNGTLGSANDVAAWYLSGDPRVVYTNGPVYTGNYIDATGSTKTAGGQLKRTYDPTPGFQPAATWTGNIDLTTGAAITNYETN